MAGLVDNSQVVITVDDSRAAALWSTLHVNVRVAADRRSLDTGPGGGARPQPPPQPTLPMRALNSSLVQPSQCTVHIHSSARYLNAVQVPCNEPLTHV